MKKTTYVLLFTLLACYSCSQKNTQEKTVAVDVVADTVSSGFELQEEIPAITPRFLSLIQYIDNSGYLFDTLRFMSDKIIEVDKYILFEEEKEKTDPFFFKAENDREEDMYVGLLKNFDLTPLKKAQKVILYYFKKVEPDIRGDARWYPDGMIEEWTFENERRAKKAAQELIDSPLGLIYFNTGAFVCQKENNMYIFYSRASAFMYDPQRKFFDWFVAQNDIELHCKRF